MMMQMVAAFAEFERSMLRERTNDSLSTSRCIGPVLVGPCKPGKYSPMDEHRKAGLYQQRSFYLSRPFGRSPPAVQVAASDGDLRSVPVSEHSQGRRPKEVFR
jgi:hypothetical protein